MEPPASHPRVPIEKRLAPRLARRGPLLGEALAERLMPHRIGAMADHRRLDPAKFKDPEATAAGERRASVALSALDTLWFNTGTLCNIKCAHCYVESSPRNDRLVYLTAADVVEYLDEAKALGLDTREIGFTGGEPFVNPQLCDMLEAVLGRGYEALVLTNAMAPMMRPEPRERLLRLNREHLGRLTLRVSLDHYTDRLHDTERGAGSFGAALEGMRWLSEHGFRLAVAGRTRWGEDQPASRRGYRRLFDAEAFDVDADDPTTLVLFPEMDEGADVPEITVGCWRVLDVDPDSIMCATSRMVVKRKGAARAAVVSCTLLPYDPRFEFGRRLADAMGPVMLNHPHCARFCVLGGGSCSLRSE